MRLHIKIFIGQLCVKHSRGFRCTSTKTKQNKGVFRLVFASFMIAYTNKEVQLGASLGTVNMTNIKQMNKIILVLVFCPRYFHV